MCGICGVFVMEGSLPIDARQTVSAMSAALTHRGPDGDGTFFSPRAILGHRRLAIIDPEGGHQPMANEDGSIWVVYNGEIFNHRELRSTLEAKGHRFRTASDTETIIHAYEQFGSSCVERFDGMFAFAIYDGRRQELFAARDRLGEKPFFYSVFNGMLHFASELPALARAAGWKGEIDYGAIEGYLSLGYFMAPGTVFHGVHKLLPGHSLTARDGRVHIQQYWDITEFDSDQRSAADILDDIDATLRTAVPSRLESDVPLGAFLSGGMDSSLIVSYMSEQLGHRLNTTTVGFAGHDHNELAAADLTAAHFGAHHYAELITPEVDDFIAPVIEHIGEPLADSSLIPTWFAARAAKRHVGVVLSGDGGDESFAGYSFRYVPHAIESLVRQGIPRPLAHWPGWIGARWPRNSRLPRPLRLGTVLENISRNPADAYFADLTFLKSADTRRLMGLAPHADLSESPVYEAVTEPYRRCNSSDPVQCAEYADLKVYLPNDPLVKVDRMSMAHALEVRCPFLDHRLVELAFRIPASRKQLRGQGKVLLRSLARRRLPDHLWRLPKQGFTAPIGEWVSGPFRARFREELFDSGASITTIIDQRDLERRLVAQQNGASHGYALWAVWALERWLQQ